MFRQPFAYFVPFAFFCPVAFFLSRHRVGLPPLSGLAVSVRTGPFVGWAVGHPLTGASLSVVSVLAFNSISSILRLSYAALRGVA